MELQSPAENGNLFMQLLTILVGYPAASFFKSKLHKLHIQPVMNGPGTVSRNWVHQAVKLENLELSCAPITISEKETIFYCYLMLLCTPPE
jgi:hypothetical protein